MKERPILFSGPMVQAILAGRKTQTRRVVKPQPVSNNKAEPGDSVFFGGTLQRVRESRGRNKAAMGHLNTHDWNPYGVPGDRLWVKEKFVAFKGCGEECGIADATYVVLADGTQVRRDGSVHQDLPEYQPGEFWFWFGWRPSIHMPRWASRITLEVVSVRVEMVQSMGFHDWVADFVPNRVDEEKALATFTGSTFQKEHSAALWNSINGKGSWESNPWVWVVEFKRLEDKCKA